MAKASPKPLSLDRTKRQLKRLFANPEMTSLAWNYEVGKLVEVIHPAKAGSSYGNSTIQDLANDIQEGGPKSWPSVLTQARKFANQHKPASILVRVRACGCGFWLLACYTAVVMIKARLQRFGCPSTALRCLLEANGFPHPEV